MSSEYWSGRLLFLGHVGDQAVLTGLGGTRQIVLQSSSFLAAEDQQSSGREEGAMGTVGRIVEGEKDDSQMLQIKEQPSVATCCH